MKCKRCAHGLCNSDSRYSDKPYMDGVTFHSFPSAAKEYERRMQWVFACNRLDFDINSVNKSSYVCSKHFVDPGGPSDKNRNPVLATASGGSCRSRRKLRTTQENNPSGILNNATIIPKPVAPRVDDSSENITGSCDNIENIQHRDHTENIQHHDHTENIQPRDHTENIQPRDHTENIQPRDHTENIPHLDDTADTHPRVNIENPDQRTVFVTSLSSPTQVKHTARKSSTAREVPLLPKTQVANIAPSTVRTPEVHLALERVLKNDNTGFSRIPVHASRSDTVFLQANVLYQVTPCNPTPLSLYKGIVLCQVPKGWTPLLSETELHFLKIHNNYCVITLKIDAHLQCCVFVYGKELISSHPLKESLPMLITSLADIYNSLLLLDRWKVCTGNTDTGLSFSDMFLTFSKIKDCEPCYQTSSLRSKTCMKLLPVDKKLESCTPCRFLMYRLKAATKRRVITSNETNFSSKCNLRYLSMTELQKTIKKKQEQLKCSTRKISRLRKKIEKIKDPEEKDERTEASQMVEVIFYEK